MEFRKWEEYTIVCLMQWPEFWKDIIVTIFELNTQGEENVIKVVFEEEKTDFVWMILVERGKYKHKYKSYFWGQR